MDDFGRPLGDMTDPGDTELRLKGSLRHVGPFCAGALIAQEKTVVSRGFAAG